MECTKALHLLGHRMKVVTSRGFLLYGPDDRPTTVRRRINTMRGISKNTAKLFANSIKIGATHLIAIESLRARPVRPFHLDFFRTRIASLCCSTTCKLNQVIGIPVICRSGEALCCQRHDGKKRRRRRRVRYSLGRGIVMGGYVTIP